MHIKNLWLAFLDQGPPLRFIRNLVRGNLLGLFHIRSHENWNGKPKIAYGSKATAIRAAESMAVKKKCHFSNYKCVHCAGYHIGKSRARPWVKP